MAAAGGSQASRRAAGGGSQANIFSLTGRWPVAGSGGIKFMIREGNPLSTSSCVSLTSPEEEKMDSSLSFCPCKYSLERGQREKRRREYVLNFLSYKNFRGKTMHARGMPRVKEFFLKQEERENMDRFS